MKFSILWYPPFPFYSKAYFSRCIPEIAEDVAEGMAKKFYSGSGMSDFVGDVIADIKISWKEIIYMSLVALGTFHKSIFGEFHTKKTKW